MTSRSSAIGSLDSVSSLLLAGAFLYFTPIVFPDGLTGEINGEYVVRFSTPGASRSDPMAALRYE